MDWADEEKISAGKPEILPALYMALNE